MSGVIGFTKGEGWFVGGWGWRTLMECAIEVADCPEDKRDLESSLYSHGLFFEHLRGDVRRRLAGIVRVAAEMTMARFVNHPDEYEVRYTSSDELSGGIA